MACKPLGNHRKIETFFGSKIILVEGDYIERERSKEIHLAIERGHKVIQRCPLLADVFGSQQGRLVVSGRRGAARLIRRLLKSLYRIVRTKAAQILDVVAAAFDPQKFWPLILEFKNQ
ncbi:MAG: hypothetical protein NTW03_05400 [Verrucomicrobia bacterium]|nr:hypothetical protein [Verrucomicrobiota bacterium]